MASAIYCTTIRRTPLPQSSEVETGYILRLERSPTYCCRSSHLSAQTRVSRLFPFRSRAFHAKRLDDREDQQDRRKPTIHLDKQPAIVVCESDTTTSVFTENLIRR